MTDVFVSYKTEDRRRVEPLVQALESDGLSVWWDAQIGGGSAWRGAIEAELNSANCVIVVWSKRSVGSEGAFVHDEAARALRRHVYMPVTIDKVDPPLGFGETQAVHLGNWKGDRHDNRYQAVLGCVRAIAGRTARQKFAIAPRGPIDRRTLIGGAVIILGAASASGWLLFRRGPTKGSNSIAVLPFENLSGDPRQDYFSDGVAEELRSALARIAHLQVAARTSSEIVRNDDAVTAARKLGVANMLTGSVRRSADLIRITTQLVDGRSGLVRWSATYDRKTGDVLKIQTDIAGHVAEALNLEFGFSGIKALQLGETQNPIAHDEYLKAVGIYSNYSTAADLHQALAFAEAAIQLDRNYAKAYALKSIIESVLVGNFAEERNPEEAGRQAIKLAPDLSSAHIAVAKALLLRSDLRGAGSEFERAAATGANSSEFLIEYSLFLIQIGAADKALGLLRQAERIDPLNLKAKDVASTALFIAARYPEAIEAGERVLAIAPGHWLTRIMVGDALMLIGRPQLADQQYAFAPPDSDRRLRSEAVLAWRLGNRQVSNEKLHRLIAVHGKTANTMLAEIYAQRGQKEEALAALDRGFAGHEDFIGWIAVDPLLAPLRKEPRFQAMVHQLNIPQAS